MDVDDLNDKETQEEVQVESPTAEKVKSKKRKVQSPPDYASDNKKAASSKRVRGIDDQAEESGEEDGENEEGSDDGSEEEDDTNYVEDDFLVRDDANSDEDEDSDDGEKDGESGSEEEDAEVEKKKKLQRLKRRKDDVQLDEEDEQLIQEYEASQAHRAGKAAPSAHDAKNAKEIAPIEGRKRSNTGESVEDADAADVSEPEDEVAQPVVDRNATNRDAARRQQQAYYEDDDEGSDMGGFIVDEDSEGGESGEDDATKEERRARRRAAEETGAGHLQIPHRRTGRREGPSYDQIQEAMDIFGAGFDDFESDEEEGRGFGEDADSDADGEDGRLTTDKLLKMDPTKDGEYLEAMGGHVELSKKDQKRIQKLRSRYERSHIVATFCTEKDDVLRRVDKPERLQEVLVGRETPQEEERGLEARWMAAKLAAKMIADDHLNCSREALCHTANPLAAYKSDLMYLNSDAEREEKLQVELQEPIANVLRFLQLENWEVPFIWTYRRDYLHPVMTKEHLWTIFRLEEDWDKTVASKMRLSEEVGALEDAAQLADHDANQNDSAKLGRLQADVRRLGVELESLRSDLRLAEAEEKQAMDRVDEKEEQGEPTDEDRERVAAASAEVEQLQERLKADSAKLQVLKQEEAAQQARQQRRSKFSPAAAKEVMRLFPVDRYLAIVRDTTDDTELRDVLRYFRLLAQNAEAGAEGSVEAADESQTPEEDSMDVVEDSQSQPAVPKPGKLQTKKSLRMRKDEYARYMNIPALRKFVETLTVPISHFGDGLRHGFKAEPPATMEMTCEDYARQLAESSGGAFKSDQHLLKAARVVIGTEMSMEPSVRGAARAVFLRVASVSTHPTPKGLSVITPFSEYFGLHLLHRKPLADFYRGSDRTMFIKLVEAERLGLIVVNINAAQKRADESSSNSNEMVPDLKPFLSSDLRLMLQFLPSKPVAEDPHAEFRPSWDRERLICLQMCVEHYLCPALQKEFRRDLIRLGKEAIVDEAARNFSKMLAIGPYVPPYQDSRERVKDLLRGCPNRPFYGTVAAIFVSVGRQEPLCMAYVNKDGVLRAHDLVPAQAMNQKNDRIKKFLVENRPDLVVINASGASASRSTCLTVEKNILKEVEEEIRRRDIVRREGRIDGVAYADDDEEIVSYKAQVMIIKDDLPKIFMNSQRSKKMFPELQPAESAAVSLARFAQEPLAEYCGAWNSASPQEIFGYELLFLNVHPLKPLLKGAQQALLNALEYRLVDAVCEMGVDVNKACAYDHLAPLLAFVGGLGLRKADALRQNVRKGAKAISSRNDLLLRKLLGSSVWTNAAGFLRICDNVVDPLDNSRIHPECYTTHDFATKICADALEVTHTNNDYVGNVEKLMAGVRRVLEKRMDKHKGWLDLWENGQRPVQGVTRYTETVRTPDGVEHPLSVELGDILSQLELDDYAAELEESGQGKRRLLFEQIKEELRFPCLDLRLPLVPLTPNEMFFLLTGETDQSLYVGLKVGGTVTEISDTSYLDERTNEYKRRQRATVQTDAGLRGYISAYDVMDSNPHERINVEEINLTDKLRVGQHVETVVVGVKKDKLQLDLSIKPSLLSQPESWWMRKEQREGLRQAREWWEGRGKDLSRLFDRYFLEDKALKMCSEEEAAQQKSSESISQQLTAASLSARGGAGVGASGNGTGGRNLMRVVHHPLFANLDFKAAEERMRLEGKGAGEVLVRPSSKGVNFLTITWAFQENWYKHISVEEKGKRAGDLGLGTQLYVQEDDLPDPYNDLDELFSRYIEPMNDLVSVMVKHRSFMKGTEAEVTAMMFARRAESPQRIPYYFRFEANKPGTFTLTWLSLNIRSENPVKNLRVEVRPYGLRAQGEIFARPSDLVVWFKATQEAQAAAQVAATSAAKQKARHASSTVPSMPLPPQQHMHHPALLPSQQPGEVRRASRFHN